MCLRRNIAMRDYQESVTTGKTERQTGGQTDVGQSDPYVPLCFAADTHNVHKCAESADIRNIEFFSENSIVQSRN